MNYKEIRRSFLDYFKDHGHKIVRSSSLIPHDDPTLLFTNAGMVQFKSLFLGETKRPYTRAASSQKCMRAGGKHNDLENVGYTLRHHTFFEMLGNFSFGDYFKEEAITWAWELLTEIYTLPKDRLYVSVYKDDDEAFRIWQEEIGLPPDRIVRLGDKDNFWSMGDTGPCGPCSEILIDQGPSFGCNRPDCGPGCDCDRYLEIWNLVFTQFDRNKQGQLIPLPSPNIDTGMGLERLASVVQRVKSNYDTDLFAPIIRRIEDISGKRYGDDNQETIAFRVISDHTRASAFLIADGVMPSNEGRGYVLRRIIRRAIRFGQVLGITNRFFASVCMSVVETMGDDYEELVMAKDLIKGVINNEEKRFADTLDYSMRLLDEEIQKLRETGRNIISGDVAFKLYDTYGLSIDLLQDVARDKNLSVDIDGFNRAMLRQKIMSQKAWKGSGEAKIPKTYSAILSQGISCDFLGYNMLETPDAEVIAVLTAKQDQAAAQQGDEAEVILNKTPFYGQAGGQVGDTGWLINDEMRFRVTDTIKIDHKLIIHKGRLEKGIIKNHDMVHAIIDKDRRKATAANHTATHLLHAVLRDIIGEHVKQAGSLVSPDRLRFDFSHFTQVDWEKLMEIEQKVNNLIQKNMPVTTTEMSREEAMKTGAMAIFEERYGDVVRVVKIGDGVSMELCGGTHVRHTGDIAFFKIVSEEAVAANIRRIEALTGKAAVLYVQAQEKELRHASMLLKTNRIAERIEHLLAELKNRERQIESLKARLLSKESENLTDGIKQIGKTKILAKKIKVDSPKELRESADRLRDKVGSGIIFLGAEKDGKAMLVCVVSKDLVKRFKAGEIIKETAELVGGKGGGRPDMAQGGGNRPEGINRAIETVYNIVALAEASKE
ncbi:MAG: alanine--tRNA ligase [Deltaproteobacteria bacterium]|nr:alanine--tRNA ligase [Deltaproteobacteria bacterium]